MGSWPGGGGAITNHHSDKTRRHEVDGVLRIWRRDRLWGWMKITQAIQKTTLSRTNLTGTRIFLPVSTFEPTKTHNILIAYASTIPNPTNEQRKEKKMIDYTIGESTFRDVIN